MTHRGCRNGLHFGGGRVAQVAGRSDHNSLRDLILVRQFHQCRGWYGGRCSHANLLNFLGRAGLSSEGCYFDFLYFKEAGIRVPVQLQ